ncbi:glucose-6-phosphate isomerase family protein [Streptomyces sp. NPDC050636]|uniref:glucose-6-phosphate isomerase family protein n=1 Tax=Streptomyces sp. NPDC050636 TaxID=3154510 RepID=UPI00344215F4
MSTQDVMPAPVPVPPVKLTMVPENGALTGNNGRYEKFLPDLKGLYRDSEAFEALLADDDGKPVYWVESSQSEDGPGGLITGVSVLEPGKVGDEYFMTRGHLHAQADRSELYVGLAGHGVMLLETLDGQSNAIEIKPGEAVYVPGHWVHRSVNVGTERLVTLFCYASDAGQDYQIIERAGGMKELVVEEAGHWTTRPNPDHGGYRA